MIGYYVHHHGRGHVHRAVTLCASLGEPVTGLSSLPRPASWQGAWVQLPPDDGASAPYDVTAGGALHWVPLHDPGVRSRASAISAWLEQARPRLLVVDVSVEAAVLARLHGVPVVTVVQPGRRDDPAHALGFRLSSELVAAWPREASGMTPGLAPDQLARIHPLGGVSRLPPVDVRRSRSDGPRRVVLLQGKGDPGAPPSEQRRLADQTPQWHWTFLGGEHGTWVDDPAAVLADADVVVTHAGQGAIADVAASRAPAVIVPAERPFEEQVSTAAALDRGDWPAVVRPRLPEHGWPELLEQAAALDGDRWSAWVDGQAGRRFAHVLDGVAVPPAEPAAGLVVGLS